MNWQFPAKTFLLGEYAAIAGESAIILTTAPCFKMSLVASNEMSGIHPESPAGIWWAAKAASRQGLLWSDPYCGRGGMGASSAQFLGAYYASCHLSQIKPTSSDMLLAFYQCAWQGQGLRPSGYDVLAQSEQGCVYINRQKEIVKCFNWPFQDISFILLHTGIKLATHHHLKSLMPLPSLGKLSKIVEHAKIAFEEQDSEKLIDAVNAYHQQLTERNLIARHSLQKLDVLRLNQNVVAAKGCGAMGADVLLLIVPSKYLEEQVKHLTTEGWSILATSNALFTKQEL